MAQAVDMEFTSPFITAQKDPDDTDVAKLHNHSSDLSNVGAQSPHARAQPIDSPSEVATVYQHQQGGFHGPDNVHDSPGSRMAFGFRLWGNKSQPHSDAADCGPSPVRVMPLSSGWFDSGLYDVPEQSVTDHKDQKQQQHQAHQQLEQQQVAAYQHLWGPQEQCLPVQDMPEPPAQQQQQTRGVGYKQSSKLHKLLSNWGSTALNWTHSKQHASSASPCSKGPCSKHPCKLPSRKHCCAQRAPTGKNAAEVPQHPSPQQWNGLSPATSVSPAISFDSTKSPDGSVNWWPHDPQQHSPVPATPLVGSPASVTPATSVAGSGFSGSPGKPARSPSPSRFRSSAAAVAGNGMLLEELPSVGEVREDVSLADGPAVAPSGVAAHQAILAESPLVEAPAPRCSSLDTAGKRPSRQWPHACDTRRRSRSAITTSTSRGPRRSLERVGSLRAALVALDHASSHAGRFIDKMSQGLARVTSFAADSGALKLPVGREVLKDWELGPVLGQGASCVTRLAFARHNGGTAACKTICKSGIFRSAAVKAAILGVQRELAIMQHTSGHPNVVQLKGVYEDGRNLNLVMEWCGGGSLTQLVEKAPYGRCGEVAAAAVAKAVLEVLALCHAKGVIHRDIKLDNLLLSHPIDNPQQVTADIVKVTDFGISVPFTPGQVVTELAGTLEYMAPEVLQRRYCQEADIWSTGVVLYELISGRLPYIGHTAEQMLQAIQKTELDFHGPGWDSASDEVKSITALMLTQDPASRPSAQQLLHTFHDWLQLGMAH